MKRNKKLSYSVITLLCVLVVTGCSESTVPIDRIESQSERSMESSTESNITEIDSSETEAESKEMQAEPTIVEVDWSEYFKKLNGAAVFYHAAENQYFIYNHELATTRRSPCSTFKIISSLIGLENGTITKENSVRNWSGESFWKKEWNQDIDFAQAFSTSCVWYFREVINEIGSEIMQEELDKLQYGNCDISDWEGHLNTNNQNPALTGFWIESSLKISPKEQAEVMKRIFEEEGQYQEEHLKDLKEVMQVRDQGELENPVYGKTGTGKADGITVDSWFTGFVETKEGNVFFCVYLGETEGEEVSSAIAKEIALALIENQEYQ